MVREGATRQYKELNSEGEMIDKKLKIMIKVSGRSTQSFLADTARGDDNASRYKQHRQNDALGREYAHGSMN